MNPTNSRKRPFLDEDYEQQSSSVRDQALVHNRFPVVSSIDELYGGADALEISKLSCRSVNHYGSDKALRSALLSQPHEQPQPIRLPQTTMSITQKILIDSQHNFGREKSEDAEVSEQSKESKDRGQDSAKPDSVSAGLLHSEIQCSSRKTSQKKAQSSIGSPPSPLTDQIEVVDTCDWMIDNLDSTLFQDQTIDMEMKRLLVLRSFHALDYMGKMDSDQTLRHLTAMAAGIFNVSLCSVTLVDFGRLYFLRNFGVEEDYKQIPRRVSFCAYTILVKEDDDIFQIPDTFADPRFRNHPFTKSPAFLRFYAGAPLVVENGVRLGSFCILDTKPRPELTNVQKDTLRDFAKLAVDFLVARKNLYWQKLRVKNSTQLLASAANDLLTPLTGLQQSLSLLRQDISSEKVDDDEGNRGKESMSKTNVNIFCAKKPEMSASTKVDDGRGGSTPRCSPTETPLKKSLRDHRLDCLSTAQTCATIIGQICESIQSHHDNERALNDGSLAETSVPITPSSSAPSEPFDDPTKANPTVSLSSVNTSEPCKSRVPTNDINGSSERQSASSNFITLKSTSICNIPKLIHRLKAVMEAIPKQVPVVVYVDPATPLEILADELPIFRAVLNLLSGSCDRSRVGIVRLNISMSKEMDPQFLGTNQELFFECFDSGPVLSSHDPSLDDTDSSCDHSSEKSFAKKVLLSSFGKSTLSSVSALVRSVGGDFGVVSLDDAASDFRNNMPDSLDASPTTKFWFKIPLFLPDHSEIDEKKVVGDISGKQGHGELPKVEQRLKKASAQTADVSSIAENRKKKWALVIDDSIVIRKTLTRALKGLGYETELAEDGLVGLRKMKAKIFDIVLCDFLMPVMDGMDCVREYREWEDTYRSGGQQFIVGMSAHASKKDAERAIGIGMNKCIEKPIFLQQLKDLTEEADRLESSLADIGFELGGDGEHSQQQLRTLTHPWQMDGVTKHICLIGADPEVGSHLEDIAKNNGFSPFLVENGEDLFRLMKARHWKVVLVDDSLFLLGDGVSCMQRFRDWEKQHRVHRQKHVFIVSSTECENNFDNPSPAIDQSLGIEGMIANKCSVEVLSEIFAKAKEDVPFVAGDVITCGFGKLV